MKPTWKFLSADTLPLAITDLKPHALNPNGVETYHGLWNAKSIFICAMEPSVGLGARPHFVLLNPHLGPKLLRTQRISLKTETGPTLFDVEYWEHITGAPLASYWGKEEKPKDQKIFTFLRETVEWLENVHSLRGHFSSLSLEHFLIDPFERIRFSLTPLHGVAPQQSVAQLMELFQQLAAFTHPHTPKLHKFLSTLHLQSLTLPKLLHALCRVENPRLGAIRRPIGFVKPSLVSKAESLIQKLHRGEGSVLRIQTESQSSSMKWISEVARTLSFRGIWVLKPRLRFPGTAWQPWLQSLQTLSERLEESNRLGSVTAKQFFQTLLEEDLGDKIKKRNDRSILAHPSSPLLSCFMEPLPGPYDPRHLPAALASLLAQLAQLLGSLLVILEPSLVHTKIGLEVLKCLLAIPFEETPLLLIYEANEARIPHNPQITTDIEIPLLTVDDCNLMLQQALGNRQPPKAWSAFTDSMGDESLGRIRSFLFQNLQPHLCEVHLGSIEGSSCEIQRDALPEAYLEAYLRVNFDLKPRHQDLWIQSEGIEGLEQALESHPHLLTRFDDETVLLRYDTEPKSHDLTLLASVLLAKETPRAASVSWLALRYARQDEKTQFKILLLASLEAFHQQDPWTSDELYQQLPAIQWVHLDVETRIHWASACEQRRDTATAIQILDGCNHPLAQALLLRLYFGLGRTLEPNWTLLFEEFDQSSPELLRSHFTSTLRLEYLRSFFGSITFLVPFEVMVRWLEHLGQMLSSLTLPLQSVRDLHKLHLLVLAGDRAFGEVVTPELELPPSSATNSETLAWHYILNFGKLIRGMVPNQALRIHPRDRHFNQYLQELDACSMSIRARKSAKIPHLNDAIQFKVHPESLLGRIQSVFDLHAQIPVMTPDDLRKTLEKATFLEHYFFRPHLDFFLACLSQKTESTEQTDLKLESAILRATQCGYPWIQESSYRLKAEIQTDPWVRQTFQQFANLFSRPHEVSLHSNQAFESSNAKLHEAMRHIEMERNRLAEDLALTKVVQNLLLPKERALDHPLAKTFTQYLAASESGGDWWWIDANQGSHLRVLIADVTGHGAGSAMITAALASSFHTSKRLFPHATASELLLELNRSIYELCREDYLVALTLLELTKENNLTQLEVFASGGSPVLLQEPFAEVQTILLGSAPLGYPQPQIGHHTQSVQSGTRILLMTDGVYEFPTPEADALGIRGLRKHFKGLMECPFSLAGKRLQETLSRSLKGSHFPDDLSFILLEVS